MRSLLSGPLLLANVGYNVHLVALDLTTDDQSLPRGGDEQRSSTGDNDGNKKQLLFIVAEVALDTIVAEEEENAAAGYTETEDLNDL